MKGEVGEKGVKATEQDYKDLQEFITTIREERKMGARIKQTRGLGLKPFRIRCDLWDQDIEGNPVTEAESSYIFNLSREEYDILIRKLEDFLQENTSLDFGDRDE